MEMFTKQLWGYEENNGKSIESTFDCLILCKINFSKKKTAPSEGECCLVK